LETSKQTHSGNIQTGILFGREVFLGSVSEYLHLLWSDDSIRTIGYFNAHTINLYHEDADYRAMIDEFDLIYLDGMAPVRTTERLKISAQERVNAGDFIYRFFWKCKVSKRKIALIGGEEDTISESLESFKNQGFSSIFTVINNGYFMNDQKEKTAIIKKLSSAQPDFVLLGIGSPLQETFALELKSILPNTKIWCVGALFEYFAHRHRAPVWMRELGLEWAFRLILEPNRLWKRYLVGNILYKIREKKELSRRLK